MLQSFRPLNFVLSCSLSWFLAFSFGLGLIDATQAQTTLPACTEQTPAGKNCMLGVEQIRPSQSHVGMRQVLETAQKMRSMSAHELDRLLMKKIAPIAIGPQGRFHLLDRHHQTRAYLEIYGRRIPVTIKQNWAKLPLPEFFRKMTESQWLYLKDVDGSPLRPEQLPHDLRSLQDDPYRSLAGDVEDGGYYQKKDGVYFIEFTWGLFFRQTLRDVNLGTDSGYAAALKRAILLACSPLASHLPGWTGCKR